jgi:hypothetical protein
MGRSGRDILMSNAERTSRGFVAFLSARAAGCPQGFTFPTRV